MPGLGLVGLAVFVDDEVELRMLDLQQIQPDVRRQPRTRGMREEAENLDVNQNLVDGEIGRLTGRFGAMDDEAIGLDRKMPRS